MRLYRIQLSGVSATLLIMLLSGVSMLTPSRIAAQTCSGTLSTTPYSATYGNTVTVGGGSAISGTYSFTLPKFPTSTSTLYAVVIKSHVTESASLTITNTSTAPIPAPYDQLFRTDGFSSTPASSGGATVSNPAFGGSLAVGASETVNMPNVLNNVQVLNDSIINSNANFSQFTGTGTIPIAYSDNNIPLPSSGTTVNSFTLTDQITFSVTYYFCTPGTLAEELLTFTAVRNNSQSVLLNWSTANEEAGRKYVLEVSSDGTNFTDTATTDAIPASGDALYSYTYPTDPNAKGRLYFRLRIEDVSGPANYSAIRIVDLGDGTATGFSIYPNPPSDFINLTFPGDNQNWQVEIYAADGKLVQQNYFPSTNLAHLNFARKMASGAYFVRAVNPQTNQKYSGSFVIRN